MAKVSIVSPLDAQSSYGLHTMAIARRLPRHGFDVVLRPTRQTGPLPDDIQPLVQRGENDADIELILSVPTVMPIEGKPTLYYSMCESTVLPKQAVQLLNMANVVAVPSDWCATVFSANGVAAPVTVPLGCDEAFTQRPVKRPDQFTFACAGNLANGPKRKGIERVMELFIKAFPTGNVRLKVKLNGSRDEQSGDKRITFHTEFLTNEQLADWLSASDCFVNLATGGFELWPLQAMRCGVPVISHVYGGTGQFLNRDNGLVVDHRMVPAGDSWKGLGCWAEADDETVISAMRYAVRNQRIMAAVGATAAESVKDFTMGKHVERLAQLLRSMLPKKKPHVTQAPSRARQDLITVVVPVCAADVDLAIEHAQWLGTLPCRTENTALVVTDTDCPLDKVEKLEWALRDYFTSVTKYRFSPPPVKGWPQAANWAFQQVALYMARWKQPWLWLEPDCVVLSDDWLEKIQAEYDRCHKRFMGAVVKGMGHMNGCAVYPADLSSRAPHAMSCTDVAFDYAMKEDIEKDRHDASRLIQHIWSVQGENASENQEGPAPTNVTEEQARRWLHREAVLVHRVKDASLINLLKGGFRKTRVEVVVTNWRRPGNIPLVRDAIRAQTERVRLTLIDASESASNACNTDGFDRVFKVPNLGSWNRMVIAGGYDCEYTLFVDDDVLPGPTTVERLLQFAKEVGDNFSVLGFKGRDYVDGNVAVVDDPREGHKTAGWLTRVYFIKTANIQFALSAFHMALKRTPCCHDDVLLACGVRRATNQPCYVLPPIPGMLWDHLPENDAVWQQARYKESLLALLNKLEAA